jgi:hypothetical protein
VIDGFADVCIEMQSVAPYEIAVSPKLPLLAQQSFGEALATRSAAKDYDISPEKPRVTVELHDGFTRQARPVEQDRLKRQKLQRRTRGDRQRLSDPRCQADCAIDFLRRRGRDVCGGTFCEANANVEFVASHQAARGRKQDGERRITGFRRRKQHAQGIALIKVCQAGDTAALRKPDFGNTPAQ